MLLPTLTVKDAQEINNLIAETSDYISIKDRVRISGQKLLKNKARVQLN